MKKTIVGIVALLFAASCVNPSMERGFASLNKELTEVATMLTDIYVSAETDINEISVVLGNVSDGITAYAEARKTDEENIATLEVQIANMNEGLNSIADKLAELKKLVDQHNQMIYETNEQLVAMLTQISSVQTELNELIYITDRDRDGVHNDIDQCPDKAGPLSNMGCPN